jgi:hypothetical protein
LFWVVISFAVSHLFLYLSGADTSAVPSSLPLRAEDDAEAPLTSGPDAPKKGEKAMSRR